MGVWTSLTTALLGWLATKNVCYEDYGIGCFDNKSPYNNADGKVPESPADIQVIHMQLHNIN